MPFDDEDTGLRLGIAFGYKYIQFLWQADGLAVAMFGFLGFLLYRGAAGGRSK
jgi:hypothetical protein